MSEQTLKPSKHHHPYCEYLRRQKSDPMSGPFWICECDVLKKYDDWRKKREKKGRK